MKKPASTNRLAASQQTAKKPKVKGLKPKKFTKAKAFKKPAKSPAKAAPSKSPAMTIAKAFTKQRKATWRPTKPGTKSKVSP